MKPEPRDPRDPRDPNDQNGPLSRWLEPAIDEPRIARAWQRIRSAQVTPRRRRGWLWLAAPAAALLAAAALWLSWLRPSGGGEALRAVDEKVSLAAGAEVSYAADVIALRDGSRMILEERARLQVLENDGERFVASLRGGTARLAVEPGPRRWTIETELATIEVIAAVVTIAHHEHLVQVSVERGVVMVRGERVPGRVARLTDGQRIAVRADVASAMEPPAAPLPAPAAPPPPASSAASPAPAPATSPPPPPPPPPVSGPRRALEAAPARPAAPPAAPARPAPPPRSLLDAAPAALPPQASAGEPAPFTTTARAMRDADQLRRAGDAKAAALLLEDARRQRPDDPAAGMVEYSLGRLYLSHLGEPGRAARVFTAVIDRGTPQPLIEGAMALRCEALWRSGDRAAARAALDEYQQRYPKGSRLAALTALLSQP